MAASLSSPASSSAGEAGKGGKNNRAIARRNFWAIAVLTAVLGLLSYWGLFLDPSVRPDPFSKTASLWDRLRYPVPHAALAEMPVVPIGARGELTFMPKDTGWINSPFLEAKPDSQTARTAFFDDFSPFGQAIAEQPPIDQQPSTEQSAAPEKASATFDLARIATPALGNSLGTRILQASCESDGQKCLLATMQGLILFADGKANTLFEQPMPVLYVEKNVAAPIMAIVVNRQGVLEILGPKGPDLKSWMSIDTFRGGGAGAHLVGDGESSVWFKGPSMMLARGVRGVRPAFPLHSSHLTRLGTATGDLKSVLVWQVSSTSGFREQSVSAEGTIADLQTGSGHNSEIADIKTSGNLNEVLKIVTDHGKAPDIFSQADSLQSRFWLAGDSGSLATFEVDAGSTQPKGLGNTYRKLNTPTSANLRSIYFQSGEQIGWVSSGWGEDSDDAPDQSGLARPVILQTLDGGVTWERLSYRAQPAPWALYGALPLFLIAFYGSFAAWRNIPAKPTPAIEGAAKPDKPIGWDDPDVLGIKPLANAIQRFLRNTGTLPPLTIAIEGKWGTGKSSLMNLVSAKLKRHGDRPVWFNAWHYQGDEQLLAGLLENIRTQAIPPRWQLSGLVFRGKLIWIRTSKNIWGLAALLALLTMLTYLFHEWAPVLWKNASDWIASGWNLIVNEKTAGSAETLLDSLGKLGALGAALAVAIKAVTYLITPLRAINADPASLLSKVSTKASITDYSKQLSFRYNYAREFGEVCKALQSRSGAGLVIFIDDLDRCKEERVMDVLEAVNFLVSAGECFIILGIDRDRVKERVFLGAKVDPKNDPDYADKYLEKLFNMSIKVPEATAEGSLKLSTGRERADTREKKFSPWPARLRNCLRFLPEMATVPVLLFCLALSLASFVGTPPANEAGKATAEPAAKQASPQVQVSTDKPAQSGQGSSVTLKPSTEAVPIITADKLTGGSNLAGWIVPGLLFAGLALLAVRRAVIVTHHAIEDSAGFLAAMEIWHPAIFAKDPTPRAIKKFQNRMRFQAMRMRPDAPQPDWLDRLFGNDVLKSDPTVAIDDATIVGLGSIDTLCGGLPQDAQKLWEPQDIVTKFKDVFAGYWPPTPQQIAAYRGLLNETDETAFASAKEAA